MKSFLQETILKAGDAIMEHFGQARILGSKENITAIVTEADMVSNKLICDAIREKYPVHGIITEESDPYQENSEFVWYIDPLDGTKNFASSVPLFGVNIALAQKGDIVLAAIYLPATKDLVIAEKGCGAFMVASGGERKLMCSQKTDWKGVFGIGPIKYSEQNVKLQKHIFALSEETAWVSAIASPAVSAVWMADGRRDWYTSPGKNSWDFAAPSLIAREAGCKVVNLAGKEWAPGDKGFIVTNTRLYPDLIKAVHAAYDLL